MLSIICGLSFNSTIHAQETMTDKIVEAFNIVSTDINKAKNLLNFDESLLTNQPYDAQAMYHFTMSQLCQENKNHDCERHLLKCKQLLETKVGVTYPLYLQSIWSLGKFYIDAGDDERALSVLRDGFIIGATTCTSSYETCITLYGFIISLMTQLYEKAGNLNMLLTLCEWDFEYLKGYYEQKGELYYHPFLAEAMYCCQEGRNDLSLQCIEKALEYINSKIGQDNYHYAINLLYKGNYLSNLLRHDEALQAFQESLSIIKRNTDIRTELKKGDLTTLIGNMIVSYASQNKEIAVDIIEELHKECVLENNLDFFANSLYNSTKEYINNRNYNSAEMMCDKLLSYEQHLNDANLKEFLSNYKNDILQLKKNQSKIASIDNILSKSVEGSEEWIEYNDQLAYALCTDKQFERAINIRERLRHWINKETYTTDYFKNLIALNDMLYNDKRWDEMYDVLTEVEQFVKNYNGTQSIEYASVCNGLAVSETYIGKYEDAEKHFLIANENYSSQGGTEQERFATLYHNMGRLYLFKGDCKKSVEFLEKAQEIQNDIYGFAGDDTLEYLKKAKESLSYQL